MMRLGAQFFLVMCSQLGVFNLTFQLLSLIFQSSFISLKIPQACTAVAAILYSVPTICCDVIHSAVCLTEPTKSLLQHVPLHFVTRKYFF